MCGGFHRTTQVGATRPSSSVWVSSVSPGSKVRTGRLQEYGYGEASPDAWITFAWVNVTTTVSPCFEEEANHRATRYGLLRCACIATAVIGAVIRVTAATATTSHRVALHDAAPRRQAMPVAKTSMGSSPIR